jgi:hypothetical protein
MKKHMSHRRYDLDDEFFDSIDTEAKAYWLGFITADGCIRTDHGMNSVQVKLMASDANHLEKLKLAVDVQRPLLYAARSGVAGPAVTLSLSSRHMVRALVALGVTPRKSATAEPWEGPAALMPHYWRGLFDGDGCISRETARNKWALTLCGTLPCVQAFAGWAREVCGATSSPYHRSNIWYWKVAGLGRPQALARALYAGADHDTVLDRKLARACGLLAIDLESVRLAANARRAESIREAWRTGKRRR